jgi:hypothetical protein
MTHFYVEGIRFHWLYPHEHEWECREGVRNFIAIVRNWWKLPIRAFHYDNEKAAGLVVESFLSNIGIIYRTVSPITLNKTALPKDQEE